MHCASLDGGSYSCSMIFGRESRSTLSSRPVPLWNTEKTHRRWLWERSHESTALPVAIQKTALWCVFKTMNKVRYSACSAGNLKIFITLLFQQQISSNKAKLTFLIPAKFNVLRQSCFGVFREGKRASKIFCWTKNSSLFPFGYP